MRSFKLFQSDDDDYSDMDGVPPEGMALLDQRFAEHESVLDHIDGKEGDVPFDKRFYMGFANLTFKDVRFAVQTGGSKVPCLAGDVEEKTILDRCSGYFEPGEVIALMGPSGCGKSTLLDILAEKKTADYEGDIRVNGQERDRLFSRITAYVPQEDIMAEHMTVREVIEFNDYLKTTYPFYLQHDVRDRRLDMLIKDLGLAHVSDTKIGGQNIRGISGGQKRRVTLLKSYVSGANIIFADEPTSGLSATDSETCIKTMRYWAKTMGTIFIVVIHQPRVEVARLFDRLLLLTAQPGRVVFDGPMKDAMAHWEKVGRAVPKHTNPTDFFLDSITPDYYGAEPDKFVDFYNRDQRPGIERTVDMKMNQVGKSSYEILETRYEMMENLFGPMPELRESRYATGACTQFRRIFGRQLILVKRGYKAYLMSFILSLFKAMILGIGFLNIQRAPAANILAWIYIVVLVDSMGGMETMPRQVDERMLMKSETSAALYNTFIFIMVAFVINETLSLAAHLTFILVMYMFAGITLAFFWPYVLWTTLSWFVFDSLFAMVAALAKTATDAQALGIPFVLVFAVYNGFTISLASSPTVVHWLIYISPTNAAISALAWAARDAAPAGSNAAGNGQEDWDAVLDAFELMDLWYVSLIVLVSWFILFRILQVIFQRFLNDIQK
mmetsp:Transcript_21043/g.48722  ORF Transcript_21043/g.48722 Transcript_21043/m.48722 type:complete len:668 (+) Transcript_21043:123-2126(+)